MNKDLIKSFGIILIVLGILSFANQNWIAGIVLFVTGILAVMHK
jgi:hypothetical protein